MKIEMRDFKTGWYDVRVGVKKEDISKLIRLFNSLLKEEAGQHFHIGSNFEGDGGISSIEFCLENEGSTDNASLSELVHE